jgi:hypothetical protein
MKESDLVGKKMVGFDFEGGPGFSSEMEKHIGEIGVIQSVRNSMHGDGMIALVKFSGGDTWYYPLNPVLDHLVKEEQTKLFNDGEKSAPQPTKELVPVIDASTFMEVSDNPTFVGRPARREVFCKIGDVYVSKDEVGMFEYWTYVRPIKPLGLTLEQIAEKFGVQNIRIV